MFFTGRSNHSGNPTNIHLPTKALFYSCRSPIQHHLFKMLSPFKPAPATKITSLQQPVNHQLINSQCALYTKPPHFYYCLLLQIKCCLIIVTFQNTSFKYHLLTTEFKSLDIHCLYIHKNQQYLKISSAFCTCHNTCSCLKSLPLCEQLKF